jgi:hypothetical protein
MSIWRKAIECEQQCRAPEHYWKPVDNVISRRAPMARSPRAWSRQAIGVYKNICYRAGVQRHSARLPSQMSACKRTAMRGFSEGEARVGNISWTLGMAMAADVISRAYMRPPSEDICSPSHLWALSTAWDYTGREIVFCAK